MFVSALNNPDPGVVSAAQRCTCTLNLMAHLRYSDVSVCLVFGLPPSIVSATFGDFGVQQVAGLEAMVHPDPYIDGSLISLILFVADPR